MNEKIFLLSKEEYEKYKERIPCIAVCWWLRDSGEYGDHAMCVYDIGIVNPSGLPAEYGSVAVRPAMVIDADGKVGDQITRCGFPWVVIDDHLAIAEVPIAFRRFDPESGDYEDSEIRKFLLTWYAGRRERDKEQPHFVSP